MKNNQYYQQGDVIIQPVDCNIEGKELNHLILAEGEATGHNHAITSGVAKLIIMNNILYLKVLSDYAKLKHQEHKEIDLPKGDYIIDQVREYDHFLEESRKVVD